MNDSLLLRDALAQHYVDHGLPSDGGERDSWFRVRIGGWSVRLPNPPARRRALFFHDANHVLTGYNTILTDGEMAIAGFEIGSGCGPYVIAWLINLGAFAGGLVAGPRRMFRAFVRGRRTSSIYRRPESRDAIGNLTVTQLRSSLGLDHFDAVPTLDDRLRFAGWAVVALLPVLLAAAGGLQVVRSVMGGR